MHAHARVVKKDATRVRKHDRIHSHQMLMRAPDAEVAAAEGSVQGKLTILQNDAESDGTWLASDILVCIVGLCDTQMLRQLWSVGTICCDQSQGRTAIATPHRGHTVTDTSSQC